MGRLPITLGHEVSGEVEWVGAKVRTVKAGDRVCLHYNISCGDCYYCKSGNEQFCTTVKMIGHHIDGGYAEYIAIPARNVIQLPEEISFEAGATLMCASATALTLGRGRVKAEKRCRVRRWTGQICHPIGKSQQIQVYARISSRKPVLASEYGASYRSRGRGETKRPGVIALEMIGPRDQKVHGSLECGTTSSTQPTPSKFTLSNPNRQTEIRSIPSLRNRLTDRWSPKALTHLMSPEAIPLMLRRSINGSMSEIIPTMCVGRATRLTSVRRPL
jgi:hypothetical protein